MISLTEIILAVIAILSGVITHVLDRRKFHAEIEKTKADTMSSTVDGLGNAVNVYQDLIDGIKKEMADLQKSNTELRNNFNNILEENSSLKEEIKILNSNIVKLNNYLCTVPCNSREVNPNILNCVYLADKKKAKESVKTTGESKPKTQKRTNK